MRGAALRSDIFDLCNFVPQFSHEFYAPRVCKIGFISNFKSDNVLTKGLFVLQNKQCKVLKVSIAKGNIYTCSITSYGSVNVS